MSSSLDCTTAKAVFRTHLFYAPWAYCSKKGDEYCAMGLYLPTEACRGDSTVALGLLNNSVQCLKANQGNTDKCEKVLNKYSKRQCFTPEVEEEVQKIVNYLEG